MLFQVIPPNFQQVLPMPGVPYVEQRGIGPYQGEDPLLIGWKFVSAPAGAVVPFGVLLGAIPGTGNLNVRPWQPGDPVAGVSVMDDPRNLGGYYAPPSLNVNAPTTYPDLDTKTINVCCILLKGRIFVSWTGLLPPTSMGAAFIASDGSGTLTDRFGGTLLARAVLREPPAQENLCLLDLNLP
jgi:hypothetical protein